MKMILKEREDKYGYKGGAYVQEISRLMKNFKDRWWNLSWKASRPTYFQRYDENATKLITLNSKKKTSLKSLRMKLSNHNGAYLFQVKEDDCNIIVK